MDLNSIGRNIKRYRTEKGMKQDKLAELTNLSPNYIGMLERADKLPSLTALINIANALGVTADMLLCDVLDKSCEIKNSILSERIESLPETEKKRIFAVIETMLEYSEK